MRTFIAALAMTALLTANSYAQGRPAEPSEQQKAESAKKRIDQQATDEAYKSTIKRTPDVPKPDPWGIVRTPSANGSK
jgi:hypothetical protein